VIYDTESYLWFQVEFIDDMSSPVESKKEILTEEEWEEMVKESEKEKKRLEGALIE